MTHMQKAAGVLAQAKRIVFFTGAGISAESGIPTFRDKLTGLWANHDPERLETADAFRENPALVWGWYLWRRRQVALAQPNAGHHSISNLKEVGWDVSVITQNIDDLHERAGVDAVVHLHGSLLDVKCFACHRPIALEPEQLSISKEGELVEPPRCSRCNGRARPGVVWFRENLPEDAWLSAMRLVRDCDVLISVGTSGVVRPAADLPEMAIRANAIVIHVNLEDVSLGGDREIMLIGSAAQVLPVLLGGLGAK
ncbi:MULTISPECIES: SIR2 family NAD-dependent protein deacylase [Pseudomonas]|uniref:SIR2 family NAD-dependent protein deacylase n=1 Tax=Pseudomonas TaxID=286 RepID=UPI001E5EB142|nr:MULTISPECIES: NAD-dependent deacylase [Pseudomonas]MCE0972099.1 NAD-dependent deacylase [Pseudomonas putida]MCE1004831.1 NAD-dependent deacylase [Pseudomonas sp. NMI1173_11]